VTQAEGGETERDEGDERSMKVTRPLDLALAQILVAEETVA